MQYCLQKEKYIFSFLAYLGFWKDWHWAENTFQNGWLHSLAGTSICVWLDSDTHGRLCYWIVWLTPNTHTTMMPLNLDAYRDTKLPIPAVFLLYFQWKKNEICTFTSQIGIQKKSNCLLYSSQRASMIYLTLTELINWNYWQNYIIACASTMYASTKYWYTHDIMFNPSKNMKIEHRINIPIILCLIPIPIYKQKHENQSELSFIR